MKCSKKRFFVLFLLLLFTINQYGHAQLGSGWAQVNPTKRIHLDDAEGLKTFTWTASRSVCSPTVCADYSYNSTTNTEEFRIFDYRSNRSEIRLQNEYNSGIHQFEGYVTFYEPLHDESLFQIFGNTGSAATHAMMRGYRDNGGQIRVLGGSTTIASGVYGKEVRINMIHKKGEWTKWYVNGQLIHTRTDNDPTATHYWKYGVYGTTNGNVPARVQWRNVRCFRDGTEPGGVCTPTAITPYIRLNGGSWSQTNTATLNAGGRVDFGPQPTSGGSWRWTGPNNFSATSREITINNIQSHQAGNYTATYTNSGGCSSSSVFTITVITPNQPPTVSLTAPANNATFTAPVSITITASASDTDGNVTQVAFYNGNNLLGTDNSSPYSFTWNNVAAGTYSITARATDNAGATTTSAARSITVNAPPTCEPVTASGHDGNVPANVLDGNFNTRWSASGDGQWIQFCLTETRSVNRVDIAFFQGNTRRAFFDVLTSLDGQTWNNALLNAQSSGTGLALESFTFSARNAKHVRIVGHGNSTNAWNSFTEVVIPSASNPNQAPSVSLTAPANNASYTAPTSITITASASDADGTISRVEFFSGSTKLGERTTTPYSYTWNNVAAGTYTITARATDNSGATTTSAARTVTVTPATTDACSSLAQYVENGGYAAGSRVKNVNNRYECKPWPYSGWCNGSAWAYAPGVGTYWADAWTLLGSCSARTGNESSNATSGLLLSNAPNPFSEYTEIELTVIEAGEISVNVYNKTGQLVKIISEGYLSTGTHHFPFDASQLNAGMYIVQVKSASGVISEKMVKME